MALLETEMVRFAESLDDYEHVSVTDMGGWGPDRYWLVVHDHRFDADYEIASHCNYWEVLTALAGSSLALGCLLRRQEQAQEPKHLLSICIRNWVLGRQGRSSRSETDRRRISGEVA